ncbi:MAG: hypothetical protein M1274_03405, partial [Actinobacteria bacterium]|nr:hypothetical protein [Actinomycetota bacterium]
QGLSKARATVWHALVGNERDDSEGSGGEHSEASVGGEEVTTAPTATARPGSSVISFLRVNAWFAVVAAVAASLTAGAFILTGRRKETTKPLSLTTHATQRAAEVGQQAIDRSRDVATEVKKAFRGTTGRIMK